MVRRFPRLLPLLFVYVCAPALLAQTADLRVSLTMPPTTFYSLVFGTVTITNAGNVPAQDVSLDFTGGLGLPALPYKGLKCSSDQSTTHCTVPQIVPGSVTLPIAADWYRVPAPGTIETMSVTVSSSTTPDPDFTNNTASASTAIVWQSDLAFDSLNVPSTLASGSSAAIDVTFSNHGPSTATGVSLTISIPEGARYEGYLGESWLHCNTEPPLGGHGDLVCKPSYDDPAGLPVGNASVEVLMSVDPSLAPGTVLPVHATLTGAYAPASPVTASAALTVAAPATATGAAVHVAATFDKSSVVAGYAAWETYTVSNAGPQAAEIVTLDIRPPGGFASWVGHPSLGSCSGYGPIHCTIATLAPGATMTLEVPVQTYYGYTGTVTSTAVVTWLHGGSAVASNSLAIVPATPPRRRSARH